jgi:tetratricopeptide (TPR) repeat protein
VSFDKAPPDQRERSRGIQVQVLFHLARNLREIGDTERARQALDRCAELDDRLQEKVIKPEHLLASYGETYLRDGDAAAALAKLLAAREIDPGSAVIWERLGRAYQHAGRLEDAEAALVRATQLPKGAVALIALARLRMATGRWAEAARCLVDALQQHPQGEVQIRMELAELQLALGRARAGLAELERLAAGRVPPQSTLAVAVESRIATVLLEHGLRSRALQHLRAAHDADPEREDLRRRLEEAESAVRGGTRDEPVPFADPPLPPELAKLLGEERQERRSGEVTSYFPERGFGFITYGDERKTVFFHVSQCEPSPEGEIVPGTLVSFVVGVNHRSRKQQAERIRLEGPRGRSMAEEGIGAEAAEIPLPPSAWPAPRSPRQRTV